MNIQFATCDRKRALQFLQQVYPSGNVEDTPESAGPLLELVEQDIVRVQDPAMYGNQIQVVPGKKWQEDMREEVMEVCQKFHDGEK